jgi:hypothetical protein
VAHFKTLYRNSYVKTLNNQSRSSDTIAVSRKGFEVNASHMHLRRATSVDDTKWIMSLAEQCGMGYSVIRLTVLPDVINRGFTESFLSNLEV